MESAAASQTARPTAKPRDRAREGFELWAHDVEVSLEKHGLAAQVRADGVRFYAALEALIRAPGVEDAAPKHVAIARALLAEVDHA